MRRLKVVMGFLAFMFLLGYFWLRYLPYHTIQRMKQVARVLGAWGASFRRLVVELRWEQPNALDTERESWFIWCHHCHRRFGMAVRQGDAVQIRVGPKQTLITLDEAAADQMSLQCRYCGKPVPIVDRLQVLRRVVRG